MFKILISIKLSQVVRICISELITALNTSPTEGSKLTQVFKRITRCW